jgi:hypothetical protein
MALTTYTSPAYSQSSTTELKRPYLWEEKYKIENLPVWIYTDNQPPKDVTECEAKLSSLNYTIRDIELQIEIRELELKTGSSRHGNAFDFERWKVGALKAKQTHLYLLNAYTYWLLKNTPRVLDTSSKLDKLITLLIEDPKDFEQKATALLD